jgi:hypothetical protein
VFGLPFVKQAADINAFFEEMVDLLGVYGFQFVKLGFVEFV